WGWREWGKSRVERYGFVELLRWRSLEPDQGGRDARPACPTRRLAGGDRRADRLVVQRRRALRQRADARCGRRAGRELRNGAREYARGAAGSLICGVEAG